MGHKTRMYPLTRFIQLLQQGYLKEAGDPTRNYQKLVLRNRKMSLDIK